MIRRSIALGLLGFAFASGCGSKTGLPEFAHCTSYAASAELAPLDVFIAMDTSGSMDFVTASGATKYAAVQQALSQFLYDSDSAGIGVTISFFPQVDAKVPEYCASPADCGSGGDCLFISTCRSANADFCHTDADCSSGDSCGAMGRCSDDPSSFCYVADSQGCFSGSCIPVGLCPNHYVCDASQYAPVLPVETLPGAANDVLTALASHAPLGGTPTLPALAASLSAASAWQKQHSDHKAIVLLATDGLPTVCDPAVDPLVTDPKSGIPKLVNAASKALADGIETFVIGVFAPEEAASAQANLGQIAKAGGSGDAFVLSTQTDVSESFLTTLNKIRREAKACEFALPAPDGNLLDATRVVVSIATPGGTHTELARRDSAAGCDPASGGFYFDSDPFGPTPPGRVTLCPASCQLAQDGALPVSFQVDCSQDRLIMP